MVVTGLARLVREQPQGLMNRRIGLVTHPAAILPDFTHALDSLRRAGLNVVAIFGPEHGWSGAAAAGAPIPHTRDDRSGLPVYSLYGDAKELTPAMLAEVEALLFDMQDVGARFYTYLSTLFHVLRGAARADKPVWVLDRPNPLNGLIVEGPLVEPGCESFVGIAPIPIRHGLTLGELAEYFNSAHNLQAKLTVIPMEGWRRTQWFDETSLPWTPTSPNMPHLSTTIVYPGTCLLEGTNLSVGRGTALPFEICGAPWVDAWAWAESLNALDLPGVRFRQIYFEPTADPYAGEVCKGVQVHVTDREALRSVSLGLHIIAAVRAMVPSRFEWNAHFDRLMGTPHIREELEAGRSPDALIAEWAGAEAAFARTRANYLLYA